MIPEILYNVIIFPIVQVIELCYLFVLRVFHNPAVALIGVSAAVSTLTLPLYLRAEKWQEAERAIQSKLAQKAAKIKAAFSGDERYMILSAYYRQNQYHPVYALRNSFGILIQVPFFIAAYSYLSHLEILQKVSFLFIRDLGRPDALLPISFVPGGYVNILPFAMTLINCVSGAVYTRGFPLKDKVQLYGMSAVFLILLYNSPAGLVIYWTCNNIFSLLKNILHKIKHAEKIVFGGLFLGAAILDIYLLFRHPGDLPNRLLAVCIVSCVFLLPLLKKIFSALKQKKRRTDLPLPDSIYILSCVILFLLNGAVVPAALIASSVEEFSFIGNTATPLAFIAATIEQSAGIFLFWPLALYFLFTGKIQRIAAFGMCAVAGIALVNVFLITENFGFLTTMMTLSEPKSFPLIPRAYIINAAIVCAISLLLILALKFRKKTLVISMQTIASLALAGLIIINVFKIQSNFNFLVSQNASKTEKANISEPQYRFSKSGKNVLLIMLDCAVGFYTPYILEEKPELRSALQGFMWYPNCVSFGNHTLVGALPIYGGYEYAPAAVNARTTEPLLDKQKEAYLLLPKLFGDAGYGITVTDPPFDNYHISNLAPFSDLPGVRAENLNGKYTAAWLKNHPEINMFDLEGFLKNNLIRFSFFKSAPLFLRLFIYDRGKWLVVQGDSAYKLSDVIINDYAFLDTLNQITATTETGDTYTALYAHLPHDTAFLQAPDYTPVEQVTNKGNSPLSGDARFHVTMASFLLLNKFFEHLKTNGVYDNTRIIIVSDHGRGSAPVKENFTLPNGDDLQFYNALLMVKDFNANAPFESSPDFMTNADASLLALEGLIPNPVNPWTNQPLKSDKANGVTLATIGALSTYRHNQYLYTIGKDQWLFVHDNIFNPDNWKKAE